MRTSPILVANQDPDFIIDLASLPEATMRFRMKPYGIVRPGA
jgi:hypothetical protein